MPPEEREGPRLRKRKRTVEAVQAPVPSPQPPVKRQKRSRHSRSRTPPEFWDNLSRVPLCRRALREFDRRIVQPPTPKLPARLIIKEDLIKQLKRFARHGGPDLRDIRGYSEPEIEPVNEMPSNRSGSGRSRSSRSGSGRSGSSRPRQGTRTDPSSALDQSTRPTTYSSKDPAFEQALIDGHYYPEGYDEDEPDNTEELMERFARYRASLSPSVFSREHFLELKRKNRRADGESAVMNNVFPIIRGGNTMPSGGDFPFNHLEPLADNISRPKPDYYNGSLPSEVHPQVREDLGKYIIPCSITSRPLLPNFFMEAKGPDGKASEMQLQITQDLAAGARGMHQMQSYGQEQPVYDNNAYTIGTTYHSGTGTLQLYSMHPTPPVNPNGQPEYHTTQINSYGLTGNADTCRQGIAAFRNAQDWAKEQRDHFITYANGVAAGQLQQELEEVQEEEEANDNDIDDTDDDDEEEDDEVEADTSNTTHSFAHSTLNEDEDESEDEDEDEDESETSVEEEYRPPPQKRSKPQPAHRKKSKKQSSWFR